MRRTRAIEIIALLRLESVKERPAGTLPYGLQKRVDLARALVARPRIVLLDEPMAGMTATEKREMAHFVRAARDKLGAAVVLIEHDIGVVMDLSDRIAVLDYGRKIADGTQRKCEPTPPLSTPIWVSRMTKTSLRTRHERLRLFVFSGSADRRPAVRRHVFAGRNRLRPYLQNFRRAELRARRHGSVRGADLRRHSRTRRSFFRSALPSRSSSWPCSALRSSERCCSHWSTSRRSLCSWPRSGSPIFSKAAPNSSGARRSTASTSASTIRRSRSATFSSVRSTCSLRPSRRQW